MDRETAKRLLPVIAAFAEGKRVQWRPSPAYEWQDVGHDTAFSEHASCYRIAPEPQYRPFSTDELPGLVGKVVRQKCSDPQTSLITDALTELVLMAHESYPPADMLEQWVFRDSGLPCGIKLEGT